MTTSEATKPDVLRVQVGGTTIPAWLSGLHDWERSIMPVRLLTRARWRFRVVDDALEPDLPAADRTVTTDCVTDEVNCSFVFPPDTEPNAARVYRWLWTQPGNHDVTIAAFRKQQNGDLTELCRAKRTYAVAPPSTGDVTRRAVDYYVNGGSRPSDPNMDAALHLKWHSIRDKERYFMGEDWLAFHRMLVRSFDDWRSLFGYPPVTPYDGATPVPTTDRGFTMTDATRPTTNSGTFQPNCYPGGGCTPPPWFTATGDGVHARPDDATAKKCYYAPDRNGAVDEVPIGQMQLGDFRDARGLGCVLNATHHALMHESVPGAFRQLDTTPRDPLFWAYHKFVSGYGPDYTDPVSLRTTAPAAAPPEGILTAWERVKSEGPPGITAVFPPNGISVTQLPGLQVLFWEPVEGVRPGDLTVNGSHATTVVGSGTEFVFSGFTVPGAPGPGGSVPLAIELASGAIKDIAGTPFPGAGWQLELQHDTDADDVPDDFDNCQNTPNPGQENTDALVGATFAPHADGHEYGNGLGDDLGDACDPDDDGDGISDADEIAAGSDPLDWQSPDKCPLDTGKTEPGECGCGRREITDDGGAVTCVFATAVSCAMPAGHAHPATDVPPSCDDGDACTVDACVENVGCTHMVATGRASVACPCDQPLPPDCAGVTLPKPIANATAKVCRLARKAADSKTKVKVARRLLRKAAQRWKAVARLGTRRKIVEAIPTSCRDALGRAWDAALERTTSTTP